jgi:Ca-activated chloride channel homolog
MRTATVAILLVLALGVQALAQNAGPALVSTDTNGAAAHLRLAKVDIDVRVLGSLADTTMTLVFANPEDRQREGDLYFPVPEGASVCGYALDFDGQMRDGVFVEAARARQAYTEIVRRMTDPALLELVKGNTFRARVFPIPAHGTRTIAVRYVKDLSEAGEALTYRLPLAFKEPLDEFHLRLEVAAVATEPKVTSGQPAGLEFIRKGDSFAAETTLKDKALSDTLIIALPRKDALAPIVEKGPDGKVYFAIHCAPPAAPAPPKRVTVLWDASGSRAAQDHTREMTLLAAWLARFPKNEIAVDLVVFRHQAEPALHFTATGGKCEKLLDTLAAISYDGGTRLASLAPAAGQERPDLYLLFTDGISSFDVNRPRPTRPTDADVSTSDEPVAPKPIDLAAPPIDNPGLLGAPLYVFITGTLKDPVVMEQFVKQDGGTCFNLDEMDPAGILARMDKPGAWFDGATVTGGKVTDLCPSNPRLIVGDMVITGRIEGDEGAISVRSGPTRRDLTEMKFTVSARGAATGKLLRFLWATQKVADLQAAPKPDGAEIVNLSKTCGVVTAYTSLIVLESLPQHLQYHIRPPDTMSEMQKQYDEQMALLRPAAPPTTEATVPPPPEKYHPDPREQPVYNALVPWYFRQALWDAEYAYPPDFRYTPKEKDYVSSGGVGVEFSARMYTPIVGESMVGYSPSFGGGGGMGSLFGGGGPVFSAGGNQLGISGGTFGATPAEQPVFGASVVTGSNATPTNPAKPNAPIVVIPGAKADDSYLKTLAAAPPEKQWAVYLSERPGHTQSAVFFMECADFFQKNGQDARAAQVISNLAELDFSESLRLRAMTLLAHNRPDMAAPWFEQALAAADPVGVDAYDLARLLEQEGKIERAAELLLKVALGEYAFNIGGYGYTATMMVPTSPGLETVALVDLNRLIPKLDAAAVKRLNVDRRLIHHLEGDLRVVITWDSGDDVDLIVTEPSGEKCFFDHALTTIGGQLWLDAPALGPEEYCLRHAMPGAYKIELVLTQPRTPQVSMKGHYAPINPPTLVRVDIYTDFGRPTEQHELRWVELRETGKAVTVKEVRIGLEPPAKP